jgi:hypothetical protein
LARKKPDPGNSGRKGRSRGRERQKPLAQNGKGQTQSRRAKPAGRKSIQLPEFVPARTVDEAQEFARALGVKQVDYQHYLAVANHVNEGLYLLKKRGVLLPNQVVVDSRFFHAAGRPTAFAAYVPSVAFGTGQYSQAFVINPRYDWKNIGLAVAAMKERSVLSTDHPHHLIFHEAGHMAYHRAAPEKYGRGPRLVSEQTERFKCEIESVRGLIGGRAFENYREYVGEVFAMKMTGVAIPSSVQKLYDKLGGPKVKRIKGA